MSCSVTDHLGHFPQRRVKVYSLYLPQPHPPMHVSLCSCPDPSNQVMQSGRRRETITNGGLTRSSCPVTMTTEKQERSFSGFSGLLTHAYQMHAHTRTDGRMSTPHQVHVQRHTCKVVTPVRPYPGATTSPCQRGNRGALRPR